MKEKKYATTLVTKRPSSRNFHQVRQPSWALQVDPLFHHCHILAPRKKRLGACFSRLLKSSWPPNLCNQASSPLLEVRRIEPLPLQEQETNTDLLLTRHTSKLSGNQFSSLTVSGCTPLPRLLPLGTSIRPLPLGLLLAVSLPRLGPANILTPWTYALARSGTCKVPISTLSLLCPPPSSLIQEGHRAKKGSPLCFFPLLEIIKSIQPPSILACSTTVLHHSLPM